MTIESLRRKPALRIVEEPPEPIDITLAIRADIKARDWRAVHVAGDKSPPLHWFERLKRTWR